MDKYFEKLDKKSYEGFHRICDLCLDIDKKTDVEADYKTIAEHSHFRGKPFAFPRPVYLCEDCYNYLRALVKD